MKLKVSYQQLLERANAVIETVSLNEAQRLLEADEVVFVDIRDVRELERVGQIPGAVHAPRGMLEFWVDPECKYHKPIFASGKRFIFYCQSAWRSALATQTVQAMGLHPVAHLEGGIEAWIAAGLPVVPRPSRKRG